MADYTVKKVEEMPRSFGGGFIHARASLGVGDEEVALAKGSMVRVGPAQQRQLRTKDGPAQVLVVGAVPGGAYSAPGFTELPAV